MCTYLYAFTQLATSPYIPCISTAICSTVNTISVCFCIFVVVCVSVYMFVCRLKLLPSLPIHMQICSHTHKKISKYTHSIL